MPDAVDSVRDRLDQSWNDWDVSHADLVSINDTLEALDPAQLDDTIAALSDRELQDWAGEIDSWANGLSAAERESLYRDLASGLGGRQLARVADAFGFDAFSPAIAAYAGADAKLDYLSAIAPHIEGGVADFDAGFGTLSTVYGNAQAHSSAEVVASLAENATEMAAAIAHLDHVGKLDAVLEAASNRRDVSLSSYGAAPPVTYSEFEPARLAQIIEGASAIDSIGLRTSVFVAAAPQLAAMQQAAVAVPGGDSRADAAATVTADALSGLMTRAEASAAGIGVTPTRPGSVSLNDNIDIAQQSAPFPANLGWFYDQVRNGGPWDYKQQGAQFQDFGNFNYGMTAAAAGIPETVALRAAGYAQQQAGTSLDQWGGPLDWSGSYGDDPADQAQIRAGYDYCASGLARVWGE